MIYIVLRIRRSLAKSLSDYQKDYKINQRPMCNIILEELRSETPSLEIPIVQLEYDNIH